MDWIAATTTPEPLRNGSGTNGPKTSRPPARRPNSHGDPLPECRGCRRSRGARRRFAQPGERGGRWFLPAQDPRCPPMLRRAPAPPVAAHHLTGCGVEARKGWGRCRTRTQEVQARAERQDHKQRPSTAKGAGGQDGRGSLSHRGEGDESPAAVMDQDEERRGEEADRGQAKDEADVIKVGNDRRQVRWHLPILCRLEPMAMPPGRFELPHPFGRAILSRLRLPFRHRGPGRPLPSRARRLASSPPGYSAARAGAGTFSVANSDGPTISISSRSSECSTSRCLTKGGW